MNLEVCIWLGIFLVAVVVEIISLGLTTIWFAGGSLLSMILAMIGAPVWLQIIAFFVVSIVLLVFTRPIAVKYFNKNTERTNAESIVGKQAIVTAEINNLQGAGTVTVGGIEWSARSADAATVIQQGKVVDIVSISGVKLIVKPVPEAKADINVTVEK